MIPLLRFFVSAATLTVVLFGCASNELEFGTTFDPLTAFPAEATYSWNAQANRLPSDPRLAALDLGPILEKVMNEEFAARGYREATGSAGDFRLSYEVIVHTWTGAESSFAIGSLSMFLTSPDSGQRVWTGYGRNETDVSLTHAEREEKLRQAVQQLLAEFPPSQHPR